VCCVKFSASQAISSITGQWSELEGVVGSEAVFGGKLEDHTLNLAGPSGQHSLHARVQLNTGWVC
jgi:hypothetical protein